MYVHFPWCLKKCPYCDFLSVAHASPSELPHRAYADRVLHELARRAEQLDGEALLSSVFFGGGTPSLWEAPELGRVLAGILQRFSVADDLEVTVECNPTSLDLERANRLADVGVGRLSIGVQGLDNQRLEFLGRLHDADLGLAAVRAGVESRVPRISADLIFGVHGQSPAAAREEARRVSELGVEHLSAYALTIEPGTLFGALARKGRLPQLPDDSVADAFLAVEEQLAGGGLEHYEISNYARPGCESRHNLGYWRGHEYLGLGTGAWGTLGVDAVRKGGGRGAADRGWAGLDVPEGTQRVRYRSLPSPERYLACQFDSPLDLGSCVSDREWLDGETLFSERLMLGLRLREGVDLIAAAQELGVDALPEQRLRAVRRRLERGQLEVLRGRATSAPSRPPLTEEPSSTGESAADLRLGDRLRIPPVAWLGADSVIADVL